MSIVVTATSGNLGHLVSTSGLRAATESPSAIAASHAVTEAAVRDSGIPFTLLRNGWYTENYGRNLPAARTTGLLLASVGDAKVASASRQDFAQAVDAVVTTGGRLGKTYELSGDVAWNYNDLAAAFSKLLGRTVVYQSVTPEQHLAALKDAGVPEQMVGHGRRGGRGAARQGDGLPER
jgi:NAD(P)H dehydrogenase (quinone)